jgi:hypothetical protein
VLFSLRTIGAPETVRSFWMFMRCSLARDPGGRLFRFNRLGGRSPRPHTLESLGRSIRHASCSKCSVFRRHCRRGLRIFRRILRSSLDLKGSRGLDEKWVTPHGSPSAPIPAAFGSHRRKVILPSTKSESYVSGLRAPNQQKSFAPKTQKTRRVSKLSRSWRFFEFSESLS